MNGHKIARLMLIQNGLSEVDVVMDTTDKARNRYTVGNKTIYLKIPTYSLDTLSAMAKAIHEAGHAIQHKELYLPFMLKIFFDPVIKSKRLTRIVEWDATNRALYWLLKSELVNSDDFQSIKIILANCLKTYN